MSGGLFALKLTRARPDFRVVLIEKGRRLGRGVAYGACGPGHLLNVPVSRMEVGLEPPFEDWLTTGAARARMSSALEESGGEARAAYAPRTLFGDYLQERIGEALIIGAGPGLAAVRGEAVRLLPEPRRGALLADGREIDADIVVLATGNMAPRTPGGPDAWIYDSAYFVPDPWAPDAFDGLEPGDPVLLIGAGLTMVDIALGLVARGHTGPMLAVSRRGLAPKVHAAGGTWPPFLGDVLLASPRRLLRLFRGQAGEAKRRAIPWQRVFDAARPAVPAVWRSWSPAQRRQFLRHLRPYWDVHRHRLAPRIAAALDALVTSGALEIRAARIAGFRAVEGPGADRVEADLALRGGGGRGFAAARVVNCTGPRRNLDGLAVPLFADLRERGLAVPDDLGLGLETDNSALVGRSRRPSAWLYALGVLTCPAWWEITAVPEITVQVDNLVTELAQTGAQRARHHALSTEDFLDVGAGI